MFKDKTAWFSTSVEPRKRSFWGGALSTWKEADYLFSDDASAEDTTRIFDSEDYIQNRATVFHSDFLSTCEQRRSVKSVPIGHYVLPPVSIQTEMRAIVAKFIWEKEDQRKCEPQINEVSEENFTYETEDQPVRGRCSQEDYQTDASTSMVCLCCKKQYPVNNMISGYVHIDQMKKYSGELHDFIPSFHGHSVSRSTE
ncbi:telomere repeats-binding bouquet formation protein 2 isoform X2 [Triplophysa dalaica]|uniref:telomere repeats-binding bouquet formation protein 2 isoform X2 n=1 Tax=Triplophysa dalaica TaxID=1582913 RepID=UPI0024E0027C|nr:telomere repeats-binding bouquet formation protein 2 isoform X2 [Triplophysa dalaica]